ncbi:MAG: hypothetical protein Q9209_002371 [Squamulea sp. 1 TL-2023]
MHLIPVHRSFAAFLFLLVSAVLLSSWNGEPTIRLAKRQPSTEAALLLNSSLAAIAARYLEIKEYPLDIQEPRTSHIVNKRARTLTYHEALCKGQELYYKVILGAFEGQGTSSKEYGPDDIKNGWTRETLIRSIPGGFNEAFKRIGKDLPNVGGRVPESSETYGINLVQDQPFVNSAGKKQKAIPAKNNLRAHYEVYYVPQWNAMISADTRSPKYMVQWINDFKVSATEANKRIPPLNRQSDVMWAVWKTVAKFPNDLRYIGRDSIINDDTWGIMNDIFEKGQTKKPLTWPGLTFEIDTEEAQALLGTPNGLATAYILADRAKELGKRSLSVTIWASYTDPPNQGYRMLWDMKPPTFGPSPPAPSLPPLPPFDPISLSRRLYVQTSTSIASTIEPLQT